MDYFDQTIDQYRKRLDEIKQHIEFISLQKNLYNVLKDNSSMDRYSTNLKEIINSTVQYNSIIICLYGCFEEFIDNIATDYINLINDYCTSYDDLPKSIRDKHLYKVGEFLSNPQRYKGYNLTVEECINNIYMSINSTDGRKLNMELILSHAGNLKVDKISELFKSLGINGLKAKFEDSINKEKLSLLDELIDQRNVISHSWEVEQRISFDIIKEEIIGLLKNLGEVLKNILLDEVYFFMYERGLMLPFDAPINVINNNILCINSKNSNLKIMDSILLCRSDGKKERLEIINIQIDNIDVNKIVENDIDVGIKVNKKVYLDGEYYYLKGNRDNLINDL